MNNMNFYICDTDQAQINSTIINLRLHCIPWLMNKLHCAADMGVYTFLESRQAPWIPSEVI
jgi:hypothetical protein